jgi:hypothetical protein
LSTEQERAGSTETVASRLDVLTIEMLDDTGSWEHSSNKRSQSVLRHLGVMLLWRTM